MEMAKLKNEELFFTLRYDKRERYIDSWSTKALCINMYILFIFIVITLK
jgi:hypothetical protein